MLLDTRITHRVKAAARHRSACRARAASARLPMLLERAPDQGEDPPSNL